MCNWCSKQQVPGGSQYRLSTHTRNSSTLHSMSAHCSIFLLSPLNYGKSSENIEWSCSWQLHHVHQLCREDKWNQFKALMFCLHPPLYSGVDSVVSWQLGGGGDGDNEDVVFSAAQSTVYSLQSECWGGRWVGSDTPATFHSIKLTIQSEVATRPMNARIYLLTCWLIG